MADELRKVLEGRLEGRDLTGSARILAEKRRLHHRLEVIEDKAEAGHFQAAQEDLDEASSIARELAAAIAGLQTASRTREGPIPLALRRWAAIAGREVRVLAGSMRGAVFLLAVAFAFSLAVQESLTAPGPGRSVEQLWSSARGTLAIIAPLVGLSMGIDRLGADGRSNRLHLVAARPVSRAGVVAAKALGAGAALALVLAGPALAASLIVAGLQTAAVDWGLLAGSIAATYLLGASFMALGMALDSLGASQGTTWTAGLAAYVLLGPIWAQAFQAGVGAVGPGGGSLAVASVHLLSPVAAFSAWTSSLLGSTATSPAASQALQPWLAVGVLAVWLLAGVAWAAWRAQTEGLPAASSR